MFANIKSKEQYHFLSLSQKQLREEDDDAAIMVSTADLSLLNLSLTS